jgi:hypothetical protein
MADGNGVSKAYKSLTLAEVDRIHDCANKAGSIVTVLRYAAPEMSECPQSAIEGACWAVEGLIEEMANLVSKTENGDG